MQIKQVFEGVAVRPDIEKIVGRFSSAQNPTGLVRYAINSSDYQCTLSPYFTFPKSELAKLTPAENATYYELNDQYIGGWPFFMSIFNKKYIGSDSFYPDKQQGNEFAKRLKDAKSFWDTYNKREMSDEMTLSAYTAKSYADDANLRPVVAWYYGINETRAQVIIDTVQDAFAKYPKIGYDFPLWTLNAFAVGYDALNPPEFKAAPVIGIGDGMLKMLESIGLGDAGPDQIFFHEFGHMVQFAAFGPIFFEERTPELARYVELMADALGAYFGHHPRGASFQTKRIVQIAQAMASVGDCEFDSYGHHGTPNQRAKAVYFATDLIDNSKAKGQILKAAEFKVLFDNAYPSIVAPDKL
jgi:hypothetical protein